MKNLAGDNNADSYIRDELTRAGIEIVESEKHNSEVPYTLTGILRAENLVSGFNIQFYRAWYYWVAEGRVPLDLAWKLYNHPEGKRTVRVSGHCACPPPEDPWIDWIDKNGYKLAKLSEWDNYSSHSTIWDLVDKETMISKSGVFRWIPDSDIKKEGTPYITGYHIDDQAGLLLFAEVLKGNI